VDTEAGKGEREEHGEGVMEVLGQSPSGVHEESPWSGAKLTRERESVLAIICSMSH